MVPASSTLSALRADQLFGLLSFAIVLLAATALLILLYKLARARFGPTARKWQAAVDEYLEELHLTTIAEARRLAEPLLHDPQRAHLTPAGEASPPPPPTLPPCVRDLFTRYESIQWKRIARFGTRHVGPSAILNGFIRIGTAGDLDEWELAVKPGRETIYEIRCHPASEPEDVPTLPSIYHWLLFEDRVFLCPYCDYDLRASADRCPECGRKVRDSQAPQ